MMVKNGNGCNSFTAIVDINENGKEIIKLIIDLNFWSDRNFLLSSIRVVWDMPNHYVYVFAS